MYNLVYEICYINKLSLKKQLSKIEHIRAEFHEISGSQTLCRRGGVRSRFFYSSATPECCRRPAVGLSPSPSPRLLIRNTTAIRAAAEQRLSQSTAEHWNRTDTVQKVLSQGLENNLRTAPKWAVTWPYKVPGVDRPLFLSANVISMAKENRIRFFRTALSIAVG